MGYLTPRKRADRRGASGTGTLEHWYMTVSAVGLAFMTPVVVFLFGRALGKGREAVLHTFSHPAVAILFGLFLFVSMNHFWRGAQMMLQDYVQGMKLKFSIIAAIAISYVIMAVGFFALAKIAL